MGDIRVDLTHYGSEEECIKETLEDIKDEKTLKSLKKIKEVPLEYIAVGSESGKEYLCEVDFVKQEVKITEV